MDEQEVMTYDEAIYVDVEETKAEDATPDIQLMNVGYTQFDESSNPIEKSSHYIGNKAKTNKVLGYDNVFAIANDMIKNNKVNMYFFKIFRNRYTGKKATQDIFIVELWNPVANKENTYAARKINTTAVIPEKKAPPGDVINYSGNLKGTGEFEYGEFNTSTKTFTAESASN